MTNNFIDIHRPIALIGAGQLGELALDLWPSVVDKPLFFLDEFSHQKSIRGFPVIKTSSHIPDANIQYALAAFKLDAEYIKYLFTEFLNQEILTVYDILTQFNSDVFSNGWNGKTQNYKLAKENLPLFADKRSQEIYMSVLDWRYSRTLQNNLVIDEKDKYNLNEFNISSKIYDIVIDGGSYDLSFAETLSKNGVKARNFIVVEADSNRAGMIDRDIQTRRINLDSLGNIKLVTKALWSSESNVFFYQNGLLSARVSHNQDKSCDLVEATTVENLIKEIMPTYNCKSLVKLHIEGAEWPVICGSLAFLKGSQKIDLLINLSHDEDSLIKIPKALSNLGCYDLFLRSHAHFGEGLTLFARAKEI